jgi:cytochrome c-type biogenesis protein CcmE
MKPAYMIALVVISACMAVTMWAFTNAVAKHVSVAQAMAKPGETVQVPGVIDRKSVGFDTIRGELRFDITDPKNPSSRMTIVYREPKPENFDSADKVEAVGVFKDGVFTASNLLVKCPSKYNDEMPKAAVEKK